jgi:Na+-transporting methylmalonyl-CoA/oxaloacetate decarboxylase gamma subunit
MQMTDLSQGIQIVAAGIGGVFVNLFLLMLVLMAIGRLFGSNKKE